MVRPGQLMKLWLGVLDMKPEDEMIAMQDNRGMGHMGEIILTTQARIDRTLCTQ